MRVAQLRSEVQLELCVCPLAEDGRSAAVQLFMLPHDAICCAVGVAACTRRTAYGALSAPAKPWASLCICRRLEAGHRLMWR